MLMPLRLPANSILWNCPNFKFLQSNTVSGYFSFVISDSVKNNAEQWKQRQRDNQKYHRANQAFYQSKTFFLELGNIEHIWLKINELKN